MTNDKELVSTQMYIIHWRAIKTGATGRGTKAFPKNQAEQIRDDLNLKNADILLHWIEEYNQAPDLLQ